MNDEIEMSKDFGRRTRGRSIRGIGGREVRNMEEGRKGGGSKKSLKGGKFAKDG